MHMKNDKDLDEGRTITEAIQSAYPTKARTFAKAVLANDRQAIESSYSALSPLDTLNAARLFHEMNPVHRSRVRQVLGAESDMFGGVPRTLFAMGAAPQAEDDLKPVERDSKDFNWMRGASPSPRATPDIPPLPRPRPAIEPVQPPVPGAAPPLPRIRPDPATLPRSGELLPLPDHRSFAKTLDNLDQLDERAIAAAPVNAASSPSRLSTTAGSTIVPGDISPTRVGASIPTGPVPPFVSAYRPTAGPTADPVRSLAVLAPVARKGVLDGAPPSALGGGPLAGVSPDPLRFNGIVPIPAGSAMATPYPAANSLPSRLGFAPPPPSGVTPPLPHPPAVSLARSIRPSDGIVQMARQLIGPSLASFHAGLLGGPWSSGSGVGSIGGGHSSAYPGGAAGGSAYGAASFAPGGWTGASFTPGGGGPGYAYRTDTGHTVDQYGNSVPTGSYVNSRGETITYAMG